MIHLFIDYKKTKKLVCFFWNAIRFLVNFLFIVIQVIIMSLALAFREMRLKARISPCKDYKTKQNLLN